MLTWGSNLNLCFRLPYLCYSFFHCAIHDVRCLLSENSSLSVASQTCGGLWYLIRLESSAILMYFYLTNICSWNKLVLAEKMHSQMKNCLFIFHSRTLWHISHQVKMPSFPKQSAKCDLNVVPSKYSTSNLNCKILQMITLQWQQ